jgi:tetratricopeptide (TPR) repeat protein
MSRSIHTTRKTLSRLRKQDFSDPAEKASALREARQQLRRKRTIKWKTEWERNRVEAPVAAAQAGNILFEVVDLGPYIHHACSEEDLRAVLSALPETAVEGISKIQLGLGKAYIDEAKRREEGEADPYTGRRSWEVFPGVYGGEILGCYHPGTGLIQLHAYVFDPAQLPFEADLLGLYLRLHALATFVHEVAHHHDSCRRVARGRWLADRHENCEWYAEKMEYLWAREVVLPYLERAYPRETKGLLDWVEERGGLRLELEFFLGDPRTTTRDGLIRMASDGHFAFENWVEKLPGCENPVAAWMAFAWELHWADQFELCLQLLDKVLAVDPSHFDARECRADTLGHLGRLEEAFEIANALLREDPACEGAWHILANIHEDREEWRELLEVCRRWEAAHPGFAFSRNHLRSVALCALRRDDELEAELEKFRIHLASKGLTEPEQQKRLAGRRKHIFRRAGRAQ